MIEEYPVLIPVGQASLEGNLMIPAGLGGLVIFAHGSGSSRLSPRNQYVARELSKSGLGTLLFDLLTRDEEYLDMTTGQFRFNIQFLSERLIAVTDWLSQDFRLGRLKPGYFGASTGAAAALVAAAGRGGIVRAVVARGGRPDLAGEALTAVRAPTLLIVGGEDEVVIGLNREALKRISAEKQMVIIPGATHLFEEPGALEKVAALAADWFLKHLA